MIAYFDLKACCDVICKYLVRRLGSYVSHMIAYIDLKIKVPLVHSMPGHGLVIGHFLVQ